jgi:CubicO group peptidase (beta-lactamase class C family)
MKIFHKISVFLFFVLLIIPQESAFSQKKYDFSSVDRIIENAIKERAFPSAVLVVGNDKEVIYENSYGRLTYDDDSKVTTLRTIYDLASVTKVVATTTAIMELYDQGKIDLYKPVYYYIPEFNNNGKSDITVLNLLLHNSGLTAWKPLYETVSTAAETRNAIYMSSKEYETGTKTVYSDYNAVLLGDIVERLTQERLNKFCKQNIFLQLGMTDTDYLIPVSEDYRIAPTEYDDYWRHQLLIGYVHDETAALLEGVSGNAGLFSTGPDLYKFMQMMLNKGVYVDERRMTARNVYDTLIRASTIELFTTKVTDLGYLNSRALGWETKPEPTSYRPPCGDKFSNNSFGHTGYTGTSVWCDEDKKLIVIFLTNRVYPKRGNEEIRNIRPKVHDEICTILGY